MGIGTNLDKMFIQVVLTLSVFTVLVAMVTLPDYTAQSRRDIQISDYWQGVDLASYSDYWTFTMNETGGITYPAGYQITDTNLAGHKVNFIYTVANHSQTHWVAMERYQIDWWIFGSYQDLFWYDSNGVRRSAPHEVYTTREALSEWWIQANYNAESDGSVWNVEDQIALTVYFAYNTSEYSTVLEAWDHHGLNVFIGASWDSLISQYNAFDYVLKIMFWQAPELSPALNGIIALVFWLPLIFIVALLILHALPFTG